MATLEAPANVRVEDVAARPISGPVLPGLGGTGVLQAMPGPSLAGPSTSETDSPRIAGPSFGPAVSSRPHQGLPPLWWPAFRIYYPAALSAGAPPLRGPFPLVIFVHGARDPDSPTNPDDPNPRLDYTRWGGVLNLLARTGVVVASVQMHGFLGADKELVGRAARRIGIVERWLYHRWGHRDMLVTWARDGDRRDHRHRPLGLVAHSFGILGCVRVARERGFVQAVAGVDATWENEALRDIAEVGVPSLFIAGTQNQTSPAQQPYRSIDRPKHLAAVQGADHWDWFDEDGLTPPAPPSGETRCQAGDGIAREVLAVFLHRYLNHRRDLPPSLLTMRRVFFWWFHNTAGRPALDVSSPCALTVLWNVDESRSWREPVGAKGAQTLGQWADDHRLPEN